MAGAAGAGTVKCGKMQQRLRDALADCANHVNGPAAEALAAILNLFDNDKNNMDLEEQRDIGTRSEQKRPPIEVLYLTRLTKLSDQQAAKVVLLLALEENAGQKITFFLCGPGKARLEDFLAELMKVFPHF